MKVSGIKLIKSIINLLAKLVQAKLTGIGLEHKVVDDNDYLGQICRLDCFKRHFIY